MSLASQTFCASCGFANRATALFCARCGHSTAPATVRSSISPGTSSYTRVLRGQYQIINVLGQGGMGKVYLAKDLSLGGRLVAIKEMVQDNLSEDEFARAKVLFEQEALLLASLRHSALPKIHAFFEEQQRMYLVQEVIQGNTLEEILSQLSQTRLPVKDVLVIGLQLCSVLHYLHTQTPPIIFRDLKPANIMRDENMIYLIDFGIARHFKPEQAKDTEALGSPGYAAPEQYGRSQTTPQSDIYSLGATLYFLLTGDDPSSHPFTFPLLRQPGELCAMLGVPTLASLEMLIRQMVDLDATRRPESILHVQQCLQQASLTLEDTSTRSSLPISATVTPQAPVPNDDSWGVTLLFAPEDRSWLALVERTLRLIQMASLRKIGAKFVFYYGHEGLSEPTMPHLEKRILSSRLTLALLTPDFLASDWVEMCEPIQMLLQHRGQGIIPIWLRSCDRLMNLQQVPRSKPVVSKGNDQAWAEISRELCLLLHSYYPCELPT